MGILLTKLLGSKVILTSDERWTAEQLDPEWEIELPENYKGIIWLFGPIWVWNASARWEYS